MKRLTLATFLSHIDAGKDESLRQQSPRLAVRSIISLKLEFQVGKLEESRQHCARNSRWLPLFYQHLLYFVPVSRRTDSLVQRLAVHVLFLCFHTHTHTHVLCRYQLAMLASTTDASILVFGLLTMPSART